MDEDKIDRTIEIILMQQAQFYADMQKMQESQERSEKHIGNLQEAAITLLDAVKLTGNNIDNLSIRVDDLTNTVDKLANTVDKLADAQVNTDERLNAVIFMAERYFSDKQNGNSK
jgi:seryl-tRNA synthetase